MNRRVVAVVRSQRGEYPISLFPGALRDAAASFACVTDDIARPLAIVTDENVDRLFVDGFAASAQNAGYRLLTRVAIAASESSKSHRELESVHRAFARSGLGRDAMVVAIGGGVVTDLAGFAASTYQRGIDWFAMPTTLLGQIDAAIGGKTAIDLAEGKNLVGTFWPPRAVVVDPHALATLPPRELSNGRGELLKYAVLAGESRLSRFETLKDGTFTAAGSDALEAIEHAIGMKADFCSADEFDRGERRVLNAGHTIGHALEAADGYRELSHGRAVAIGLIAEARLSSVLGLSTGAFADRLARSCRTVGLPERVSRPREFLDRVRAALSLDKKRARGALVFALPCGPGDVRITALDPTRDAAAIDQALESVVEST